MQESPFILNVLTFAIKPLQDHNSALTILPAIDGKPLTELVAAFESEHGFNDPAGGYGGLVPTFFKYGPLDRYFMGEPEGKIWADGQYLLACNCGEVGCWPLEAKIKLDGEKVIWNAFRQPHRPARDYSRFGPFEFDLKQYAIAVNEVAAQFRPW